MSEAVSQWVSVAEAADVSGVSERTIWRWCRDGVVESRQEKRGQQSTRLVNAESLPEGVSEDVRANDRGRPDMAEVGVGCQGLNGARHMLSESAAGAQHAAPADQSLVTSLQADVAFLRDQLQQRSHAEQELRVMLARLERTNADLAGALVQKALPPAMEVTPRRVRWWSWWRR
jgi:hypothetical protein